MLSGVNAVDDTAFLGSNGTLIDIDVLANDSGFDLTVTGIVNQSEWISADHFPAGPLGPGTIRIGLGHIPTEGERDAWVSYTQNWITNWENNQKAEIEDGYDAARVALDQVHAFLTQWGDTNEWLVASAGNTIWALSPILGGTAAGVGGMTLAALASIYEGDPARETRTSSMRSWPTGRASPTAMCKVISRSTPASHTAVSTPCDSC